MVYPECYCLISNSSQHAIVQVNMKVMCIVVDSIMYNGEGERKCSHYDNNTIINNRNTTNISTTQKYSKVGVQVKVTTSVATYDSISLFKTTPSCENEGVWVTAVFDFITTTTSNRSCERQYEWSDNTTNISTTWNISKVGVRVKAMIDFVAIKDSFPCSNIEIIVLTTK